MDERLKKAIVLASLGAFAAETANVVYHVSWVHGLPSALQLATVSSTSSTTSSISAVFVSNFGNASTEAIYPNVADSKVLKHDGVTVPTPPPATKPTV
jgi:hypothetical protein